MRVALVAIGLLAAVVACSTETTLMIEAAGENAEGEIVPLTNVSLDILPYDIDELYSELESQTQPGDPPAADAIRELAGEYQRSCASYRATSDSIQGVQQRATAIADRASDEYKQAFEAYQALVEREKQRFAECQAVTDRYTAVRNEYREGRLQWENQAWPDDLFETAENARVGEQPLQRVDTDEEGAASVTVPNGTWWILGDAPVPGSISQKYRWNVRVDAGGGEQVVGLTNENASLEPVF